MKKLLVIGYVWPEPRSSAAGSHMLSILRSFRQQAWQVEFATPAQPTPHMVDLAEEGISSRAIRLNCDSFDAYVSAYQPDIVLFDRFMMEEQFGWRVERCCPQALKLLDTEDLQCLRDARRRAHQAGRGMQQADLFSELAQREIAAILRCDLSLIISDYELQLLQQQFRVDPRLLHHLPMMVDLQHCPAQTPGFDERQHFVSIGNFRHAPNWDMVLYLQQLWPQIRRRLPQAELHIYGAYPPPKATALHNPRSGFLLKGWAEDAHAVLGQARLCLAPLRFGAGIKGKLLDAMCMQTPSITTSIGSEGMHGELPWPGVSSDEPQGFVDAAVALYEDPTAWAEAQQRARTLLSTRYDAASLAPALLARIAELEAGLVQHRLDNFSGAMLKHHTMASHKYMSQWIEAKNRNTKEPSP